MRTYNNPPSNLFCTSIYLDDIIGMWRKPEEEPKVKRMFKTVIAKSIINLDQMICDYL